MMMEYYPAIKKHEITSCAATLMDLEMIILSQICCLYVESKKMIKWTYLQNRLTGIENKREWGVYTY